MLKNYLKDNLLRHKKEKEIDEFIYNDYKVSHYLYSNEHSKINRNNCKRRKKKRVIWKRLTK